MNVTEHYAQVKLSSFQKAKISKQQVVILAPKTPGGQTWGGGGLDKLER